MTDLDKLYRDMPDERLLKVLAEEHKYSPEAITVAREEAASRGLAVTPAAPETRDEDYVKPLNWFQRTFMVAELTQEERSYRGDSLDEVAMPVKEFKFSSRILYLLMAAVAGTMVTELLESLEWIQWTVNDVYLSLVVALVFPFIIPTLAVFGLYRHIPAAFYLTAGYVLAELLVGLYNLYRILHIRFFELDDLIYIAYADSSITGILLTTLKILLLAAAVWLLCRREVYELFGLERRNLIKAFALGFGLVIAMHFAYSRLFSFFL